MRDPRLPHCKPPPQSFDPPEPPRLGAFHNATIDPSRQHQGSLKPPRPMPWTERPEYRWGPYLPTLATDPPRLRPLYTEKLPTSPRFPSLTEAAQRRRDFWMKIVAYGGIAMMVAAPVIAVWSGKVTIPAGAFVTGLIIFGGVCIASSHCRRS